MSTVATAPPPAAAATTLAANDAGESSIKPYIEPLNIGDSAHILWRDGTTHLLAKVVERKRDPNATELVKTMPAPAAPIVAENAVAISAATSDDVVDASDVSAPNGSVPPQQEENNPSQLTANANEDAAAKTVAATENPTDGTGIDEGEPALKRTKLDSGPDAAATAEAEGAVNVNTNLGEGQPKPPPEQKQQPPAAEDNRPKLSAWDLLYYVHYEDHDRRLDEWVPLSRFDVSTLKRVPPPDESTASDIAGMDDWGRSSRRGRASDGKFGRRGDKGRRSNPILPVGGGETALDGGNTSNKDGSGKNNSSDTNNNSDSLLRGGNWHGNSGNPDLAELEAEHHEITKVKNISQIVMGKYCVEAWYYSPFPPPYHQCETLYICEFCLKYMRKSQFFLRHCAECPHKTPPGNEIYREGNLSVFELDGKDHRVYCQNLCLLAKLFLDHKTLYYDVDPFYFYVITEVDDEGAHIVGYFSKEKVSAEDYNLACILTFPQYQKAGYGKFIISLSYELSKREGKPGSPEKPLSDLGKISYRSYWTHILLTMFAEQGGEENIQIKDISLMTGIKTEDIISTLQSLNMIRFWKGQHVVFVMQDFLKKYMAQKKKIRLCDSKCLTWTPHAERKKGGSGGD